MTLSEILRDIADTKLPHGGDSHALKMAAASLDALERENAALRDVLGKARHEIEYMASGMTHAAWKTEQARETLAAIDAAMAQR